MVAGFRRAANSRTRSHDRQASDTATMGRGRLEARRARAAAVCSGRGAGCRSWQSQDRVGDHRARTLDETFELGDKLWIHLGNRPAEPSCAWTRPLIWVSKSMDKL